MFVSEADFDFATEQIKNLKLTVSEVTTTLQGCSQLFLFTEKAMKTTGNIEIWSIEKLAINYPCIYSNTQWFLQHFVNFPTHLMNHSAMSYISCEGNTSRETIWATLVKHVEYLQFRNFDPKT